MQFGLDNILSILLGTSAIVRVYLGSVLAWEPTEIPIDDFHPSMLFGPGDLGTFIDASDISTLWQDTARTTPVTTTGQPIGRVDDLSGVGLYLSQSTELNKPTYDTSTGYPAILIQDSQSLSSVFTSNIMTQNQTLILAQNHNSGGGSAAYIFVWATTRGVGFTDYLGIQIRPNINVGAGICRAASIGVANSFGSTITAPPNELNMLTFVMGDTEFLMSNKGMLYSTPFAHAWPSGGNIPGTITTGSGFGVPRRIYSAFYITRELTAMEQANLRDYMYTRMNLSNSGRAVPNLSVPFHMWVARDIDVDTKTWRSRVSPGISSATLTTEGTGIPVMLGSRGAWAGPIVPQVATAGYSMAAIIGGTGTAMYQGPNIFSDANSAIAQLSRVSDTQFRAIIGNGTADRQKQFIPTTTEGDNYQIDRPQGTNIPISSFNGYHNGTAATADVSGTATTTSAGGYVVLGGRYLTTTNVLVNSNAEILAAVKTVGTTPLSEEDRVILNNFFNGLKNGTIL